MIKTEPSESANKMHMDEYCYDDLDVGEEFKYSNFLSRSISPQEDVLNEQTIEVSHVKKKPRYTQTSWAERKKHFQCDHCNFKTKQKSFLVSHIRTTHSQLHDENGFITCVKCSTKLTTLNRYMAHKRICGTKLYQTCKFCPIILHSFDHLEKHVVNHHPKEFRNKMELNEILQWCKSRQVRMASKRQKNKMQKSESLKNLNYSLRQLINMFCSKCNLTSEMIAGKRMARCLKCKTSLLFQCKKCKKPFEKIQAVLTHIRRLCENDNFIVNKNNKVLNIVEERPSNKSNHNCNLSQEESVKFLPLQNQSETFINGNQDGDLDVGELFKFGEFLSSSENAQINVVNEEEMPGVHVDNNRECTRTSSTEKAAHIPMTKRFECDICGYRAPFKARLEIHIKHRHSELYDKNGIITCSKCDKKYVTLYNFKLHKEICGTRLYFPCKFCSKMLTHCSILKRHIFSYHEKEFDGERFHEILQWSKCRAVRRAYDEGKTINAHLPKKKKLFRSYFDLNKLFKIFCSKCNVTSERELGKNKIRCLKCDTALMFQCQMCKKTYEKKASLSVHIQWYCKERKRNFSMDINKMASDSAIGKQQSNNSNFENLYIAPVPKGTFPKTKIDYYYCHDCDYKADRKYKLLHHIRFHHIENCDKKGSTVCPKCRRKFKHSRNCKAHQLVCSATFDYKCTFCKFTAKVPFRIQRHIKLVHPDKIKGKNFTDIANEILKERRAIKEKFEATKLKKLLVENEDLSECFDLYKVIKMICPKCHVVSDRQKYQTVKDCSKCEKLLEYQCQRCGQSFDKYHSCWKHMKKYCRLIKKKQ